MGKDEAKEPPAPTNGEVSFAVGREPLLKALRAVAKWAAVRTTLPATSMVRVEAVGGTFPGLVIAATDVHSWGQVRIGAAVPAPGVVLLPAGRLVRLLRASDAETVSVSLPAKIRAVRVEAGELAATLMTMDPAEFPSRPAVPSGGVSLDRGELCRALARVLPAVAEDAARPVLCSVYMRFDEHAVTLCAADGFRLTEARVGGLSWFAWPSLASDAINVPAHALRMLLGLLAHEGAARAKVQVSWDVHFSAWRCGDVEVVAHLAQGTFPSYGQLFPERWLTQVTVPAAGFRRAWAMVDVVAQDGSGIVQLEVSPGQLAMRAASHDMETAEVALMAVTEDVATGADRDGPARIAFNTRYLRDVVRDVGGDLVIEWETCSRQGVFRSSVDDGVRAMVMPMFVQWEEGR